MVWEDLTPARILTRDSFDNALVAYMALGGSTNATVHLIAMARRAGIPLTLADMDAAAGRFPCSPTCSLGQHLMEDFFFAGGLPALLERLRAPQAAAMTVNGRTLGENVADARSGTTTSSARSIGPSPATPRRAARSRCSPATSRRAAAW